jgi:hypothetical protein
MSLQLRRNPRRRVFYDSSESGSNSGGSESTSDEEYGFRGGMGHGGYSDAAREGYFAGYYWETSSDESESVQRRRRRRRRRRSVQAHLSLSDR